MIETTGNDWYSPPWVVDAVRAVVGEFDLDPASCEVANRVVRADRYYTVEDNGLALPWEGQVWCNPPHDRAIGSWVARALRGFWDEHARVSLLLPVSTGTSWWQPLWMFPIVWLGRLKFWRGTPEDASSPRQDYTLHLLQVEPYGRRLVEVFRNKQYHVSGYHST